MKLIEDLGIEGKWSARYGIYECPICLSHFKTNTSHVKRGKSTKCKSCGVTKHGETRTVLYRRWISMKDRCLNSKSIKFASYGGRGITICQDWTDDYISFRDWSLDNGFNKDLSIDRINNEEGYSPSNCRWVSLLIQQQNKRLQKNNTTGYSGIYPSTYGKFVVQFKNNRKTVYLGRFKTLEEAVYVRERHIIENNWANKRNVSDEKYKRLLQIYG